MVFKNINIFSSFLNWIFPPLCLACKEATDKRDLCAACWQLLAPPDPAERCRHCFSESDAPREICSLCRREPLFPIPRAFVFDAKAPLRALRFEPEQKGKNWASFALNQWIRLDWPMPDAVIPMPDPDSESLGEEFGKLLKIPCLKILNSDLELKSYPLKEGAELLIIEAGNPIARLQKGILSLSEAFPKKSYLLSLYV